MNGKVPARILADRYCHTRFWVVVEKEPLLTKSEGKAVLTSTGCFCSRANFQACFHSPGCFSWTMDNFSCL